MCVRVCACVRARALSETSSFHFIAYEILRVNEMPLILEWSHTFDAARENIIILFKKHLSLSATKNLFLFLTRDGKINVTKQREVI